MLQPQSDDEVRQVVEELRLLDRLLDVRWEPKARLVQAGWYNAEAGKRHDPVYDGRWQVIRWNTPGMHDREYVVICEVTEWERVGPKQIIMMKHKGGYAPLGPWLVEHMRQFDAAQRKFAEVMDQVWAEHDKADENVHIATHDAHREAAEKVYAQAAGPYWMGGAQGKAHPVTAAAVFGKGKKTSTASSS